MATISNLLTHWIGKNLPNEQEKFSLLTDCILSKKELLYSYCDIPFYSKYGGIDPGKWGMKMVCFTDLPLSEVEHHAAKYSNFGISFNKAHLVNNLVSPVWYTLNPYIYQAYSYLYHHLIGINEMVSGKEIPYGLHKGKIFDMHVMFQKLHIPFAFSQNYSSKEFMHDETNTLPLDEMTNFFEDDTAYYYEREWRSVYLDGSKMKWNIDHDDKNYFKFDEEAIKYIIVPRLWITPLKNVIAKYFSSDNCPNIIAYEDLKFF